MQAKIGCCSRKWQCCNGKQQWRPSLCCTLLRCSCGVRRGANWQRRVNRGGPHASRGLGEDFLPAFTTTSRKHPTSPSFSQSTMEGIGDEMLFESISPKHYKNALPLSVRDEIDNESFLPPPLSCSITDELQSVNVSCSEPRDTVKQVEPKPLLEKTRERPTVTALAQSPLDHPPGLRDRSVSSCVRSQCAVPKIVKLFSFCFGFYLANSVYVRAWLLVQIEEVFERQLDSLLANETQLSITLRSRNQQNLGPSLGHYPEPVPNVHSRIFRFPGKSEQEAWRYSQLAML